MGALKWGLKASLCNLCTIVLQLCTFVARCGPLFKGNFRRKTVTIAGNRGQLWTSTSSPHLLSPHLDFPEVIIINRHLINPQCFALADLACNKVHMKERWPKVRRRRDL